MINYDDLPNYVQTKNHRIKSKKFLAESEKSNTNHLFRSFLPEVKISSGIEHFKTGDFDYKTEPSFNIETRVNIFNSGKDLLEHKIKNNRYEIAKLDLQNEYLEQLTLARFLFAECYYFHDQVKVTKKILIQLDDLDEQTQNKKKSGLVNPSDLNAIKIYSQQLTADLTLLEEDYEHTLDQLKVVLGFDLDDKIKIQKGFNIDQSLQDNLSINENYPTIKKIKNEINISDNLRKGYQLWWTPSIDAFSSYDLYTFKEREYLNYEDRDEYVLGIQVKVPLFDKLESHTKSQSEKYKSRALQSELKHYELELESELRKLQHGLKVRKNLMMSYKETLILSKQYIDQIKEEYLNGIKNSLDVISSYDSFLMKSRKYADYFRDYLIIKAKLSSLTYMRVPKLDQLEE